MEHTEGEKNVKPAATVVVVGISGRFGVGKDYVADACGADKHSFAAPIYALARNLVGTADKSAPGVRKMLQDIGQWMRGHFDEQYPATFERGLFLHWLRSEGVASGLLHAGIRLEEIGTRRVFSAALCRRLDADVALAHAHGFAVRAQAVTNIRFVDEVDALRAHCAAKGYRFVHALVATDEGELTARRSDAGYSESDDRGVSEEYAHLWSDRFLYPVQGLTKMESPHRPDVFVLNGSQPAAYRGTSLQRHEWFADAASFAAHIRAS